MKLKIKMKMKMKMKMTISSTGIEVIRTVFNLFFWWRNFKHLKHKQKHLSNIKPDISKQKKHLSNSQPDISKQKRI